MRRFLYAAIRLAICSQVLMFLSCTSLFLPPLEIISVNISEGYNDPASLDNISVEFSREPSMSSIYKAFSLTCDGTALEGAYTFSGCSVRFVPTTGFETGRDYVMRLTTVAEDEKGLSIPSDYVVRFTTRLESVRPTVLSITPGDEATVDTCDVLTILFSEPVDPISFSTSLTLQPSFRYSTSWDTGNARVLLTPLEDLDLGTKYRISLTDDLRDLNGNAMGTPFKASFTFGSDILPPTLTALWVDSGGVEHTLAAGSSTVNIQTKALIRLVFSEPVDIESVSGYVKSFPDFSLTFAPDLEARTSIDIGFASLPEWDSQIVIRVQKGIEDLSGNSIASPSEYTLKFNAEESRPPSVLAVRLCLDPSDTPQDDFVIISEANAFSIVDLDPLIFPLTSDKGTYMDVFFCISTLSSALDLVSLMEAVSVSSTNSCATFTVTGIDIAPVIDAAAYPAAGAGTVVAVRFSLDVRNTADQGLLYFKVSDDLQDDLGNGLKSDWSIPMCKG